MPSEESASANPLGTPRDQRAQLRSIERTMVRLEFGVSLVLVSLAVLPTFASNVPSEAIRGSILVDGNGIVVPGAGHHCLLVALLTCFKGQEFGLGCGRGLEVLAL